MKPDTGPELRLKPVPLKHCPACNGKAFTEGVFYDIPCADCNELGVVHGDTSDPLTVNLAAISLLHIIRGQANTIKHLQQGADEYDPYAPATERLGGKVRLD